MLLNYCRLFYKIFYLTISPKIFKKNCKNIFPVQTVTINYLKFNNQPFLIKINYFKIVNLSAESYKVILLLIRNILQTIKHALTLDEPCEKQGNHLRFFIKTYYLQLNEPGNKDLILAKCKEETRGKSTLEKNFNCILFIKLKR